MRLLATRNPAEAARLVARLLAPEWNGVAQPISASRRAVADTRCRIALFKIGDEDQLAEAPKLNERLCQQMTGQPLTVEPS